MLALLAAFFMGVACYFSSKASYIGIQCKFLISIGQLAWIFPFVLMKGCVNRWRDGFDYMLKDLKDKESGKVKHKMVSWILFTSALTFV